MFSTFTSTTKPKKFNINLSPIKQFRSNKLLNNKANKYYENHLKNSLELKKSLSSFKSENEEFFMKEKSQNSKNGFKSFQVPRTDNLGTQSLDVSESTPLISPRIRLINSKIVKTISNGNYLQENQKMKEILKTARQKELTLKFPNINNILNQNEIQNADVRLINNKIMGERYNPFNYRLDLFKSAIRRNTYGALYQH
jgi:hypothetical protein